MSRYLPVCNGTLTVNGSSIECTGTWLTTVDASSIPGAFDINTLSPSLAAEYFGVGFGLVGTICVIAIGVGVIVKFLKEI